MITVTSPLSREQELIVTESLDCGFTVHRLLGPGYRESIYECAYRLELDSRGLRFVSEKKIDVRYRDWLIPGQRVDLIVEGIVLVELKAVPRLREIHRLQVFSYLKATGLHVGLLMNFNTVLFKHGTRRVVRF